MGEFFTGLGQEIIAHWIIGLLSLVGAAALGIVKKYWESVATPVFYAVVGGGVIFICMWLLTQSGQQFTNDRLTRPYFTQTQASIQEVRQDVRALTVSVQNTGIPAQNVVSQLLVFEESLDPTIGPLYTKRIENANAIGPNGTLSQHWFIKVMQNARPAFVMFQIRYTDALRNETHSQALFLKFLGSSQDGTFIQQLFHASNDEKTRMEQYVRERGIPML